MSQHDGHGIVTDVLTVRQALDAMVEYLAEYYRQTTSDDVGSLLGDLPPVGKPGTHSGDPAAWYDWLSAVERAVVQRTSEWREGIDQLISDPARLVGLDRSGGEWYGRILPDGRQLWARVFHGKLNCAGCNTVPRAFDLESGLVDARYDVNA